MSKLEQVNLKVRILAAKQIAQLYLEKIMSKLFFKGRIDTRQNHVKSGYNVNREIKLGSEEAPLSIVVNSQDRQTEIEAILAQHQLIANITLDETKEENTVELDTILNKPKPTTFEKTPNRNDACPCGSGKKYKKCCGQ